MTLEMDLDGNSKFNIIRVPSNGHSATIGASIINGVNKDKTEALLGVYFSVLGLPKGIFVCEDS